MAARGQRWTFIYIAIMVLALVGSGEAASAGEAQAQGSFSACPASGHWALATWNGPDNTPTGQALATCSPRWVTTAFWWDASTQIWRWYFDGAPVGINTLLSLNRGYIVFLYSLGLADLGPPLGGTVPSPTLGPPVTPAPTPILLPRATTESVLVLAVPDLGYVAIVQRTNGEIWRLEYGVGCLSLWLYVNRTVLISSPGTFAGVGSVIVIPDGAEQCPIWQAAQPESVVVLAVEDVGYVAIVRRANGQVWRLEYGVGCLSLWLYVNRTVLIYSPGIFAGVGSSIIIPARGQECRIWNATLVR